VEKRGSKITSVVLVVLLVLSTSTVIYANNFNENLQAIQTGEMSFIFDGESYHIEKYELENFVETKMYDSQKTLIGYMQYDKSKSQLFDVLNQKEITVEYRMTNTFLRLIDDEGYYFQGTYTVSFGFLPSVVSAVLAFTGAGVPLNLALIAANTISSFIFNITYIEGELWMKSDENYEYAKRIESVYETITGNDYKLVGPYTLRFKTGI